MLTQDRDSWHSIWPWWPYTWNIRPGTDYSRWTKNLAARIKLKCLWDSVFLTKLSLGGIVLCQNILGNSWTLNIKYYVAALINRNHQVQSQFRTWYHQPKYVKTTKNNPKNIVETVLFCWIWKYIFTWQSLDNGEVRYC